jgi:hypothetical protein
VNDRSEKWDERWSKVIAPGIPTEDLRDEEQDIKELKAEIEIYNNGVTLVVQPTWITRQEARASKQHSLAILAFRSEARATKALTQGR